MSEETIFATALALPPEERGACLEKACGGDIDLRQRVEALLNAHAGATFLEEPAAPVSEATVRASPILSEQAGDRIGRYKLLQQIGEGGCGVVYMAEQEKPVNRRVALKIIKLGMDTKQVIARFEAERQALAMMDHPNIAKVLDGGATETGRPYFVMELVRGVKITEYCDYNNLPTKERLELFMQVCRAIQHAHQKGIIHRDVKPSNILVTLHDGVPVPKVIDFGIAKATQGRLTDLTLFTAFEQFIGTPAYMSPEQAEISGLDVDTRTDIYSLGVLLYELLTGRTPFDTQQLLASGLDAMRRTIREQEPERPSTKLSTMLEGELTSTAKRHHTEAPKLISAIRGDLDWIVMKCLEKDRSRRYETANGLAMDLQRHLNQESVTACPPSNFYRLQKLVRRNKLAFGAGAAILITLLVGVFVSTWEAIIATRARASALSAANQAQQARISEAEQRQRATKARDEAQDQELQARRRLYLANVALAYEALQKDHLGRARELLQKASEAAIVTESPGSGENSPKMDFRGWEWRYLWSQTRGDDLLVVGRHEPMAQVALWMPDGVRAVSCGKDALVKFWQVDEPRLLNQISVPDRPSGLGLSPDGKRVAVGLVDGRVSLWDVSNLQKIWETKVAHGIGHLTYSPDGEMVAAIGGDKVSVLWTKDGHLRRCTGAGRLSTGGFKAGLAFSPDSRSLVFAVWNRSEVGRLNLQDGTEQTLPLTEEFGVGAGAIALAFSPDGSTLAIADLSAIIIWDWTSNRLDRVLRSHHQVVVCLAFSPDGTKLASAGQDQTIKVWDTRTWAETCSLRGHEFEIWSIAFSPDSNRLISAAKDDTVRVWPTAPSRERLEMGLPGLWGISEDGANSLLVILNPNTGAFTLGNIFTGELVLKGALDRRFGTETATKLVSSQMAFGFVDGHVELWDLGSQGKAWSVMNHNKRVLRLAGSARNRRIAVGYEDGRIDLIDLENGATQRIFQTEPLSAETDPVLEFSLNGKRLCAGHFASLEVPVWNLENGDVKHLHLKHREGLLAASFSDDGEWLITTTFDEFASLWEVDSGRELARFAGQFTGFRSASISADKTRVALASNSKGELSVWDVSSQLQLVSFPDDPGGGHVGPWDPNSDNIAAVLGSRLRLLHAPSWAEIRAGQNRQPNLFASWKAQGNKWYRTAELAYYRKAAQRGDPLGLNNLAWFLATSNDANARDGASAVNFAEKAVTITSRTNAMYLDTLAAAHAEVGNFDKAVNSQKEAIALVVDEKEKEDFMTRLKLYESKAPYRER